MSAARSLIVTLLAKGEKASTRATYASSQRLFIRVHEALFPDAPPIEEAMPTEEQLTVDYVVMSRFHSTSTLKGDMSAVQKLFHRLGLGDLPRGEVFKAVEKAMSSIFREADRTNPAYAFTENDMRKIRSVLDLSKKAHATFWAACTVAFWAILRVGDYTGWRALGNGVWEPQLMVKDLRSFEHFSDVAVKDPKNGGPSYRSAMAKRTDDLCSSGAVEVMLALESPGRSRRRCSRRHPGCPCQRRGSRTC